MTQSAPPQRLSRKRQQTRTRLIEAAHELFREQGVRAVSLDEIAARAGVTKGAIYGNFGGKDDLVLAVALEKSEQIDPKLEPGAPLKTQLRRIGEALAARASAIAAYMDRALELRLIGMTDEAMRQRLAAVFRENYARSARRWTEDLGQADLPLPPQEFVVVMDALITGLMIQRALTPDLVPDELIVKAVETLGG